MGRGGFGSGGCRGGKWKRRNSRWCWKIIEDGIGEKEEGKMRFMLGIGEGK